MEVVQILSLFLYSFLRLSGMILTLDVEKCNPTTTHLFSVALQFIIALNINLHF
jgi:hypothetical protein